MSRFVATVPFVALLLGGLVASCNEYGLPAGTSPHRELNFLDMGDQPKIKAQRGDLVSGAEFLPPRGSIPRGYNPYAYFGRPEEAGKSLLNPLPNNDPKVLEQGKVLFERFCVPCHGPLGAGDGKVVEKGFPTPPSLHTQKLRDWADGRVYHVLVEGQNIMPSYAAQTKPEERWAIIHHLRSLHTKLPVAEPPAQQKSEPVVGEGVVAPPKPGADGGMKDMPSPATSGSASPEVTP